MGNLIIGSSTHNREVHFPIILSPDSTNAQFLTNTNQEDEVLIYTNENRGESLQTCIIILYVKETTFNQRPKERKENTVDCCLQTYLLSFSFLVTLLLPLVTFVSSAFCFPIRKHFSLFHASSHFPTPPLAAAVLSLPRPSLPLILQFSPLSSVLHRCLCIPLCLVCAAAVFCNCGAGSTFHSERIFFYRRGTRSLNASRQQADERWVFGGDWDITRHLFLPALNISSISLKYSVSGVVFFGQESLQWHFRWQGLGITYRGVGGWLKVHEKLFWMLIKEGLYSPL